jgi:hypothetical protein
MVGQHTNHESDTIVDLALQNKKPSCIAAVHELQAAIVIVKKDQQGKSTLTDTYLQTPLFADTPIWLGHSGGSIW